MNFRPRRYRRKKPVTLKPYAIAKYLYYVLIRTYYYSLFFPRMTRVIARYVIHPLVYEKETRWNRYLRSAFMWTGGGLLSTADYRAQRIGMKVMLDYMGGHLPTARNRARSVVYLGWCVSPEFMRGFGARYIIPEAFSVAGSFMGQEVTHHMLEVMEAAGGSMESCTASKSGGGAYLTGQLPQPDLIVTSSHPCDSGVAFYPTLQSLTGVPMFVLDTPYDNDEASYAYYERNLWSMIAFLEEHLKQQMDWERLQAACEELNRTNHYLNEITIMSRAIPSPVSAQTLILSWALKLMGSGSPDLTRMAEMLYENTRKRLEQGRGWVKNEKIRMIWWDVPVAYTNIYPWLEKEFGAVVVGGDLMGRCNTPYIDTTSKESLIRTLARVHLHLAMVRNTRGPYEYITDEFEQIIADYSGDCFVFVGHNGCKHGWAAMKMKKDICKREGLPALFMSTDYADSRNKSEQAIKKELYDFLVGNGLA